MSLDPRVSPLVEASAGGHIDAHVTLAGAVEALGEVITTLAEASGVAAEDVQLALRGTPGVMEGSLDAWAAKQAAALNDQHHAERVEHRNAIRRLEVRQRRTLLLARVALTLAIVALVVLLALAAW